MHSSRMRIARTLTIGGVSARGMPAQGDGACPGGGVSAQGEYLPRGCLPRGVPAQRGVSAQRGVPI